MITALAGSTDGQKPVHYLYPGELIVAAEHCSVSTVVGSCVAVFFWDARRRQAGLNHYLLPREPRPEAPSPRFGTTAIAQLLEKLERLGSDPRALVAKVFGGAHVLPGASRDPNHLGEQNVEIAISILRDCRVPILASATGGTRGRRVIVNTEDGSAWVKEL